MRKSTCLLLLFALFPMLVLACQSVTKPPLNDHDEDVNGDIETCTLHSTSTLKTNRHSTPSEKQPPSSGAAFV